MSKKGTPEPEYIQKRREAERHNRERQKDDAYLVAINAIADELRATEQQESASDEAKTYREKVTIGLVLATFIAAAIGDVIFWRTMEDARDADRPYIWIDPTAENEISWIPDKRNPALGVIRWHFSVLNSGKGIAIGTVFDSEVFRPPRDQNVHMVPSDDVNNRVPAPPNNAFFSTAFSNQKFTASEFAKMMATDDGIVLRSTINYRDRFGNLYETDVCISHRVSFGVDYCPGNAVE